MNKCDENKIDVFQSRCLRLIFKIHWQERITNKEVLKMAQIENLNEDMRRRRWKFIGHIMRKELHSDCRTALTWAPEGRRREKGKKWDGRTGVRYKWQRLTEMVGGIVLSPYVPHGTKKIGEGEGISFTSYVPSRLVYQWYDAKVTAVEISTYHSAMQMALMSVNPFSDK